MGTHRRSVKQSAVVLAAAALVGSAVELHAASAQAKPVAQPAVPQASPQPSANPQPNSNATPGVQPSKQPFPGPTAAEFAHWHRIYVEERGKAAKGSACIRSKTCISDEADFLKPIETAHNLRKSIEGWAKAGNHHAAYYAGLMAFEQAKQFDEEFRIYNSHKDERYLRASHRFVELSDREIRRAKELLYPAAYDQHPESCMLMGEVMEYDRLDPKKSSALVFYYCAAREYHFAGNRDLAMKAYSGMLRVGHPQDPMIVEMHARLLNQQPDNPWRPMQPLSSAKPAQ